MSAVRPSPQMSPVLDAKIRQIQADILDEYLAPHQDPWIVGFSGGKDSTLVVQMVIESLQLLAPSERTRPIHIISNDTLVENPLVIAHMASVQTELEQMADAWQLPVQVVTTRPDPDATFWVNLIGRGYPPPNRSFRWCTDRLKIQPTTQYIRQQVDAAGQVILLLGVRRSESAARAATVARYDSGNRLHRHNDLPGCMVFRPIVELSTDEVWEYLAFTPPPWGGTHGALFKLYLDAGAAECPTVMSHDDAPSCGSSSSRFGCWTCTVVDKDRSLGGFVESGFAEFAPLVDFRDWLASIRNDPERRMARRRNGRLTVNRGVYVPGPFTLEARQEIWRRVLTMQQQMQCTLVSDAEFTRIQNIWAEDALHYFTRADRHMQADAPIPEEICNAA